MARAHGRSPPRARATDPVVTPSHRLLRVTIHGHMNTRRSRRRYRLLPVQRDLISDSPLDPVPGPRSNWVAHLKDGAISGEAWPQSQASRRTGSQAARRTDRHLLGPALVLSPPPPPPPFDVEYPSERHLGQSRIVSAMGAQRHGGVRRLCPTRPANSKTNAQESPT